MLSRVISWFARARGANIRRGYSYILQPHLESALIEDEAEYRKRIKTLVSDGGAAVALDFLMQSAPNGEIASRRAWANAFLADVFQDMGSMEQARSSIDSALAHRPDDADLNYRAGVHALSADDPELALDYFRLCRHYEPSHFLACSGEAKALEKLGRADEPRRLIAGFLEKYPGSAAAAFELALLEYGEGRFEEAVALLSRIEGRDAIFPEACNLKGLILGRDLGDVQAAIECFERVLLVRPGWTVALSNLGWMYSEAGQFEKGDDHLGAVLDTIPLDSEARLIRAYISLKHGRFESGWKYYTARHESKYAIERPYQFPVWTGAPAEGDVLLVYAEQGLGDHLMFSSCIRDVVQSVGQVFLECNPKLVSLFQRSFPMVQVVENIPSGADPVWLNSVRRVDWQIAMGDLPGIFRPNVESFPRHDGYLQANPERVAFWRDRIDRLGPGLKIGVSWRGGVRATRRQLRSFRPAVFEPLLHQGMHLISLQYGDVEADLEDMKRAGLDILHLSDALSDYDETAALVCALDCVVSVCTAVIHLCGALGRPALVLVPKVAEWRYLYSGETLPWYPSLRLIRQGTVGNWAPEVAEVLEHLRQFESEYFHEQPVAN